ncbi:MFS transporter [Novosphingobium sp.]|uniref:MFS transporter n=1 Tax=Novosphingobium sp. TaxID=1874826 RepID=UPI002617687C|nr:MFS transporter [Novosphingobium sp.]
MASVNYPMLRARQVLLYALTAALAGLLFGFDVAVISGAEQAIQHEWGLSPTVHGMVLSAALWGTVAGALAGAWPTDRLGRKPTLIGIAAAYVVASLGSALAPDPWSFTAFRALGGLAIGVSSIAAPAYITEIAPSHKRGRLVALYQFNIVAGILIAYFSNWVIAALAHPQSWRLMLGIQSLPSLGLLLATLLIPESPAWTRGSRGGHDLGTGWADFLRLPLRRPAGLAVTIALFNQLSGINAVIYFAPRIFAEAGLSGQAALLASVGIGVVNLFATGLAVLLIDRAGRRVLMLIGSVGYCLSLGALSLAFAAGRGDLVSPAVFCFIIAHAIGQGAVIWVFIAEIFPTRARARGQTLGCGMHWVMAALVTAVLPPALAAFPPAWIFGCFAAMMLGQFAWVLTVMPETRGDTTVTMA